MLEILGFVLLIAVIFAGAEFAQRAIEKKNYRELPDGTVYEKGKINWKGSVRETFKPKNS